MRVIANIFEGSSTSKWFLLPLLLMLSLVVVLCFNSLSFDIIGFKESGTNAYTLFWIFATFLPLLLLLFFRDWKVLDRHEKILMVALVSFFLALNSKYSFAFVMSYIFAAAVAVYFYHKRVVYRPDIFYILLIAYVLINALSLFWTSDLTAGVRYLRHISLLIYVPILFCFFRLDKKQFDLIALFIFRAMMIYAMYSICSWAIESRFLQFPFQESFTLGKYNINGVSPYEAVYAWANHVHPTYNGVILIFALGIGWYYIIRKDVRDNIGYLELTFFVIATLLLLILTASRLMLVAWALVNLLGFFRLLGASRKTVIISFLSLFLISFLAFSNSIMNFISDPARVALMNAAFDGIKENTWRGVGLGAMTDYINKDNPSFDPLNLKPEANFPHFHPHNQVIGDLMQTGVFGFLSILCIIAMLFYKSVVQRNWLLGISLLVYILLMCIEMPLIYPNGIFFFALAFSFLAKKDMKKGTLINFNHKDVNKAYAKAN